MEFPFFKYHGLGNDFVLLEDLEESFPIQKELVQNICTFHTGIGADGMIFLQRSQKANFRMRIFNSDGSEAESCGNALFCMGTHLLQHFLVPEVFSLETISSKVELSGKDGKVALGVKLPKIIGEKVSVEGIDFGRIDSGVPHAVCFLKEIEKIDVDALGRKVRFNPIFLPKGTNVNFAEVMDLHNIFLRTYERGVERETLSCGTGALATAFYYRKIFGGSDPIYIHGSLGKREISFESHEATMTGSAKFVFKGKLNCESF